MTWQSHFRVHILMNSPIRTPGGMHEDIHSNTVWADKSGTPMSTERRKDKLWSQGTAAKRHPWGSSCGQQAKRHKVFFEGGEKQTSWGGWVALQTREKHTGLWRGLGTTFHFSATWWLCRLLFCWCSSLTRARHVFLYLCNILHMGEK